MSQPKDENPRETPSLSQVDCPGCGRPVIPTAVACPNCGEAIFVEHPGDIRGVKHPPLDLPPADTDAYGPNS